MAGGSRVKSNEQEELYVKAIKLVEKMRLSNHIQPNRGTSLFILVMEPMLGVTWLFGSLAMYQLDYDLTIASSLAPHTS